MNLVGKIFTVLILVMAIVFGALAVAVYATHKNWRSVVVDEERNPITGQIGLVHQLSAARKRTEQLEAQLQKLQGDLDAEKVAKRAALTKLETEYDQVKKDYADAQKARDELDAKLREAIAALQTTQTNAANLRKETDGLRADAEKAQKERDGAFRTVVQLTDDLNQAVAEVQRLKKTTFDLTAETAKYKQAMRSANVDPEKPPTPQVDGVILAVREGGLLEVSLGSDDGVQKGREFDIFRPAGGTSTYVGRCEVVDVAADRSVCKISPTFLKTPVQRGDRVFAKGQ